MARRAVITLLLLAELLGDSLGNPKAQFVNGALVREEKVELAIVKLAGYLLFYGLHIHHVLVNCIVIVTLLLSPLLFEL